MLRSAKLTPLMETRQSPTRSAPVLTEGDALKWHYMLTHARAHMDAPSSRPILSDL